jgi:hypothetical protein
MEIPVELHQVLWKTFDFAQSGCRVSASETNLNENGKNARSLLATESGRFLPPNESVTIKSAGRVANASPETVTPLTSVLRAFPRKLVALRCTPPGR